MLRLGFLAIGAVAGLAAPLIAQPAAPSTPDGASLFRQRCVMCHSNLAGHASPLGPNLFGVVGRRAGSTGFAYSPGLKAAGITWSAQTLDRYLQSPAAMFQGSKMPVGVPDAAQRQALIQYLDTLK